MVKKIDGQVSEKHAKAQQARAAKQEAKKQLALSNKESREQRTPEQQLALLDKKFGKGQGAQRERARLLKQIEDRKTKKKAKDPVKETSKNKEG